MGYCAKETESCEKENYEKENYTMVCFAMASYTKANYVSARFRCVKAMNVNLSYYNSEKNILKNDLLQLSEKDYPHYHCNSLNCLDEKMH